MTRATLEIVTAAAGRTGEVRLDWAPLPMGLEAIRTHGVALPDTTKQALAECDGWLMGPHDSAADPPEHRQQRNPSGELRHHLDLFANIRPARTHPVWAVRRATLTSSSSVRTPRSSAPTAICTPVPASSCPHAVARRAAR